MIILESVGKKSENPCAKSLRFHSNSSIHCHCYDCDEHFEHMAASFVLVSEQQCGGWVYNVTQPIRLSWQDCFGYFQLLNF